MFFFKGKNEKPQEPSRSLIFHRGLLEAHSSSCPCSLALKSAPVCGIPSFFRLCLLPLEIFIAGAVFIQDTYLFPCRTFPPVYQSMSTSTVSCGLLSTLLQDLHTQVGDHFEGHCISQLRSHLCPDICLGWRLVSFLQFLIPQLLTLTDLWIFSHISYPNELLINLGTYELAFFFSFSCVYHMYCQVLEMLSPGLFFGTYIPEVHLTACIVADPNKGLFFSQEVWKRGFQVWCSTLLSHIPGALSLCMRLPSLCMSQAQDCPSISVLSPFSRAKEERSRKAQHLYWGSKNIPRNLYQMSMQTSLFRIASSGQP